MYGWFPGMQIWWQGLNMSGWLPGMHTWWQGLDISGCLPACTFGNIVTRFFDIPGQLQLCIFGGNIKTCLVGYQVCKCVKIYLEI